MTFCTVRRITLVLVALSLTLGGCSAHAAPAVGPPPPTCGAWGCEQGNRFIAADALIAGQLGHLGVVVRDRVTGEAWLGGQSDRLIWAGSTPKLALAVALLEQERAGSLRLDADDYAAIDAMLSTSDNDAADRLWERYADPDALMETWRTRYGMTRATYVDGFPRLWGFVQCTAEDLAGLMSYVLETLDRADRDSLLTRMRSVAPAQQWGVWGAGVALAPGVKNGWSLGWDEQGNEHWITATVGFVGPEERYVVAAMFAQVHGSGSLESGVHVVTDLVATLFGQPVPAPAVMPPPD